MGACRHHQGIILYTAKVLLFSHFYREGVKSVKYYV